MNFQERRKQFLDMMIYGHTVTEKDNDGEKKRIDPKTLSLGSKE